MKNKEKSTDSSKYIAIVKENEKHSSGTQNEWILKLESKDLQSAMDELKKIVIGEFEPHKGVHSPSENFDNGIKSIFIYEISDRVGVRRRLEIPLEAWESGAKKIEDEFKVVRLIEEFDAQTGNL